MIYNHAKGEVGVLSIANNSIVFGCSDGTIGHYKMTGGYITFNPADTEVLKYSVNSAVMSITMDEQNEQGMIGTESGNIYYINFNEAGPIRLISSNNMN